MTRPHRKTSCQGVGRPAVKQESLRFERVVDELLLLAVAATAGLLFVAWWS